VIDFTPVYLFEGTLAQEQDQLAIARGQIALSLVDLYRALGGGWEMRLPPATAGPPPPSPATTRPAETGPAAAAAAAPTAAARTNPPAFLTR